MGGVGGWERYNRYTGSDGGAEEEYGFVGVWGLGGVSRLRGGGVFGGEMVGVGLELCVCKSVHGRFRGEEDTEMGKRKLRLVTKLACVATGRMCSLLRCAKALRDANASRAWDYTSRGNEDGGYNIVKGP